MTKYIYADNFRGFKDCLVGLRGVVFLVGENSSGKSSFLALAHLLLSEEFWFDLDFNSLGHQFGHFGDLRSKVTSDKEEFTIGCLSPIIEDDVENGIFCSVLSFKERDEMASPFKCTYVQGDEVITYCEVDGGYKWALQGRIETGVDSDKRAIFRRVVDSHRSFNLADANFMESVRYGKRSMPFSVPFGIQREREKKGDASGVSTSSVGNMEAISSLGEGAWFAPVRAEPRKVYHSPGTYEFSPDGNHTPFLLREELKNKKDKRGFGGMIELFGEESGLFKKLKIKEYAKVPGSPFSISVNVEGVDFEIGTVGYGVSQALPLIVEMLARPARSGFFMQQPEVHLHPRAQAAVANILYMHSSYFTNTLVLVETHSDYILDRFKTLIRENYLGKSNRVAGSILWFERSNGANQVECIELDENGEFVGDVPAGYREFFLAESLRGLGLDVNN